MDTTQSQNTPSQLTQSDIDNLSFKEASIELEQIIRNLESGELELEASLVQYANGVLLLNSLQTRLTNAEQRVQVLEDTTQKAAETVDTTAAPSSAYVNE